MSEKQDDEPWPLDQDLPTQPRRQIILHWFYFLMGCCLLAVIAWLLG